GTTYVFVGPTVNVNVTSSTQKIIASAAVPLGLPSNATALATIRLGICYRLGTGAVTNFVGNSYSAVQVNNVRYGFSAAASITGLPPGNYQIGVGILNSSTIAIDNNDYVNGWVMLVN
ncbi:MAG: hypothetical protein ACK5CT_06200, partial [Bacteroidota bacterium]